jgi:lipopolysaccharide export system protein LptC
MPLPVYRLRRWLAVITVLFVAVVAGMYFYARLRQHSILKAFSGKISYDIKQTASGFQFSKSEAGRTVFTIRAKSVKEFKLNGRADLQDVSIILYGRDTSRFDQIYGDNFTFDPKSGNITARGEVQIDLQANPAGVTAPDQAAPK